MTRTMNQSIMNTRVQAQSAVSYYSFTKVCFAGLFFASQFSKPVQSHTPEEKF